MTIMTGEVAQAIVEKTMNILPHNINVMNEYGVIIGSGDPHRLDEIHEGAVQVIQQKASVVIGLKERERFRGANPGINLPIYFEKDIVGVIGISGNPQEIAAFGELVKMGAEMILKQVALTNQLQWDVRLQEELVYEIIHNKTDVLSLERAERLGIDLTAKRIPVLIEFTADDMTEEAISQIKKNIIAYLRDHLEEKLIASTGKNQLVILYKVLEYKKKNCMKAEISQWVKTLKTRRPLSFQVGIGMECVKLGNAGTAFTYAKEALKIGKTLLPNECMYDFNELLIPILLSNISSDEYQILQPYEKLVNHDKRGELQATLEAYIEENGELNQIAEKLFIHRNTLRYRLGKIHEVTGEDPRKMKDLLRLYVSQILYKLTQ